MKKRLTEETVIFISVFKWILLATAVGVIVGASTTLFVKTLNWGAAAASTYRYYFLSMPLGLLASALIIKRLLPGAEGHGANKVIESIHRNSGKIKPIAVPAEFLRSFITLTTGGSAGKEGPSAQIGAGLASMLADILRFDGSDRRKLVICGISGGFASVFGTPLAGAIFGMEVLFVGSIRYDVLLPSFVAGIISYQVSSWLGLTYFYNPITFVPVFSEAFFIKVIAAGIFFGLCSFFLVETLRLGKKASSAIKLPLEAKAVIAGIFLVALTFIFSESYLGLGLPTIQSALEGGDIPWYAFILKSIFTSVTLSFGGHGGIGTPIFFVGATAGSRGVHAIEDLGGQPVLPLHPVAFEVGAPHASGHKKAPVPLDDSRRDHDGWDDHCIDARCRQLFDIGQTGHFGLRATHTVAPKSISA